MAGNRRAAAADDQTKKRKRVSDADAKAKRTKQDGKAVTSKKRQDAPAAAEASPAPADKTGQRNLELVTKPTDSEAGWRISRPMGGRMLDIDPILTVDEQYLIIAYNTSIQVYAASDSLLVRRIPISTSSDAAPSGKNARPPIISSMRLSARSRDHVWVSTSDGRVYRVDWTKTPKPQHELDSFRTASGTARAMVVARVGGQGTGSRDKAGAPARDAVIILESDKKSGQMVVTAYKAGFDEIVDGKPAALQSKTLFTYKKNSGNGNGGNGNQGLQLLETGSTGGRALVGAIGDRIFVGGASYSGAVAEGFDQLRYEFFSFAAPDLATTLDVKARGAPSLSNKAKSDTSVNTNANQIVDVLVGGARGAIYYYHDAINRLTSVGKGKADKDGLQPRMLHWHRKAVHAVKWSRDGNYMISGGSENVLVLWQMDTGKNDYLPHLSGSVENITVSSSGASYAVHLDDNSAMVLSTAEMKPTAYVSGIQTAATYVGVPKDQLVKRVWGEPGAVRRPVPAAVRPSEPSRLHVCVGSGRQAAMSGEHQSAPLLQSFDLETFTSVGRQPLARTQPTDANLGRHGHPVDEPLVTHLSFSADGKWLASVDDWRPAGRDVEAVSGGPDQRDQFLRERHEVHLKFWDVGSDGQAALVSRINAPHATAHPEAVLDLASSPTSVCFATVGGDGMVRVWRPRVRKSGGVVTRGPDGREMHSWGCSQVIAVGDGLGQDAAVDLVSSSASRAARQPQGSVAFSEDGSTIFAAFGGPADTGAVHVIDAASGEVVRTLQDLWTGRLRSVETVSSFLVVLSDELVVYDVVGDELRYGIAVPADASPDLLQMRVDHRSGRFAVSLPLGRDSPASSWTPSTAATAIGVFDPEVPEPLLVRAVPHRVISLVAAPDTSGFMALDDAAQIWTVTEESDPSSLVAVQPLEDLRLEAAAPAAAGKSVGALLRDEDDAESENEDNAGEDVDMVDDDEEDHVHASVVAQQHLSEIFDAAPAFAGPSIEDMFYKVTSLLGGSKPLVAAE